MVVVSSKEDEQGRFYRLPSNKDSAAIGKVKAVLDRNANFNDEPLSRVPDEEISLNEIRRISVPLYGMTRWGDLFSARQALALSTLAELVLQVGVKLRKSTSDDRFSTAVQTCLALAVSRQADYTTSLCSWHTTGEKVNHTFGRQAIPMFWDFTEVYPLSQKSGDFGGALDWVILVCEQQSQISLPEGHIDQASATAHPLPEDSAHAIITDPPYYDSVPYAYLSDFFYVWLRRMLYQVHADMFRANEVPKEPEIVVDRPHELSKSKKDIAFYERELAKAFSEARRVLRSDGICAIVFASKTTSSWEAILNAVVDAGWIVTGSWPIDTEMEARIAAAGQARLASSVHLVCRPRKHPGVASDSAEVGDWRDVLHELPGRMHEWMPRLAEEGVVGADAIFACLGPALEIFSRYSRVEKANGETVPLKEYLEHVWATVAKEALAMVFKGADATGFEADARLTAMWLWTLKSPDTNGNVEVNDEEADSDDESNRKKVKTGGFTLEYDAARKIGQGLGAHLESLGHLVEIAGDQARLLAVAERTRHLFGKDEEEPARKNGSKKRSAQLDMFAELTESEDAEAAWREKTVKRVGDTTLDRVHQGMILFAAGRGEALKRFVVEDGVGRDGKFWRLAQALSALYPAGSDEKRWLDGVLARKKQFGF
jgi:putative DNA methylase